MKRPRINPKELRQSSTNEFKQNKKLFRIVSKQESYALEDKQNQQSKFFENRQESINLQNLDHKNSTLLNFNDTSSRFLRKGMSRSVDPEQKQNKTRHARAVEREIEKKKLKEQQKDFKKPVKVLEGDLIFLVIKSEVREKRTGAKQGFHGMLCADGVVGQGLFSLAKDRTEELQPGKYLFRVILKTNMANSASASKSNENTPVIFGQRLYLKHVFSQKYLKIELENLANEKGRVRAILTDTPSDLKIIPSTWTKFQGQNMFFGEGVLICPGDSERLFLSIEHEPDDQGRYPVNGSDVFCEWIPFLFSSESYSKSLAQNSLLNGSFSTFFLLLYDAVLFMNIFLNISVRLFSQDFNVCLSVSPRNLLNMFSESVFYSNSYVASKDDSKQWISTPIWLLRKEPRIPGKVTLERGSNPSIYSLWEIKTEGLKPNACQIASGSVVRLKNVATSHFLSFGSQISFLQNSNARLVKNSSKETTEIIAEEIEKDDSAVLSQGFSKLGRFCLKIQSRLEHDSKSLVKEDIITLSLLKKQRYQLGIFPIQQKKQPEKISKAFSKSMYGSGEIQSRSVINVNDVIETPPKTPPEDDVFETLLFPGKEDSLNPKFSEFCSSRQNHFKVLESGLDFATERLASSFLSALFEFYGYIQDFGFVTRGEKAYFDLKNVIEQNTEFEKKMEILSRSLTELKKFLSKDEDDFCRH